MSDVPLPPAIHDWLEDTIRRNFGERDPQPAVDGLPESMPEGDVRKLFGGGPFGWLMDGRLDRVDGRVVLEVLEDSRMGGPNHFRVWEDGEHESLPTPPTMIVYPKDCTPEQKEEVERKHGERYSAIAGELRGARLHLLAMDWGVGEYELTARELAPVAERVVARADIQPGETVLDLGAGTGNAALLAAQAGGVVTAVEPSARLLEVTRRRLESFDATCLAGVAEDLPLPDAAFDKAVSVFAVIFTPDPPAAARELVRVLKPGGRALVTTWVPAGAMNDMMGVLGRAVAETSPEPPPPRFGWGDPDAVTQLFAEAGAEVTVEEDTVVFRAPSAEAWVEQFETRHPVGRPWRAQLEAAGVYADVRAEALRALEAGNEDPDGLRFTSRYLVVEI